jgi:hypothetical protein
MCLALCGYGLESTSYSGSFRLLNNSSFLVKWIEEVSLAIDGDLFPT